MPSHLLSIYLVQTGHSTCRMKNSLWLRWYMMYMCSHTMATETGTYSLVSCHTKTHSKCTTQLNSIRFDLIATICNGSAIISSYGSVMQNPTYLFICRITNDHTDFIHPICKVKSQSHKCHSLVWRRRRWYRSKIFENGHVFVLLNSFSFRNIES